MLTVCSGYGMLQDLRSRLLTGGRQTYALNVLRVIEWMKAPQQPSLSAGRCCRSTKIDALQPIICATGSYTNKPQQYRRYHANAANLGTMSNNTALVERTRDFKRLIRTAIG